MRSLTVTIAIVQSMLMLDRFIAVELLTIVMNVGVCEKCDGLVEAVIDTRVVECELLLSLVG